MFKKMKTKFGIAIGAYLVLSVFGLIMEYLATPYLLHVGTPLMRHFGHGWIAVFLINIAAFALFMPMAYLSLIKYRRIETICSSYKEFSSLLYYGSPNTSRTTMFFGIPKNKNALMARIGFGIMIMLLALRAIALLEWSYILFIWVPDMRSSLPLGLEQIWTSLINVPSIVSPPNALSHFQFVLILFAAVVFALCWWEFKEYRINQRRA